MRKRPLLLIPAVWCADAYFKEEEAGKEELTFTARNAFAWPSLANCELIFSDDEAEEEENKRILSEENDTRILSEEEREAKFGVIQDDLVDLLNYRTRSDSSQTSPQQRAIDSPPRSTRSLLLPLPLELNRSQSRASQEIFDSLMQPGRGRADSQQLPDSLATSAISVSTCSTAGAHSEDSKQLPITKGDFVSFFQSVPVEIRRSICSFLEWSECNPCFPALGSPSRTPPLAWVSPRLSDSLFALRVEVFNDFDCRCSEELQQEFLDPNSKSDNLGFFVYRRLIKLKVPYSLRLINQLAYTAKCALNLIKTEVMQIDEVLGFLLVATIIVTPTTSPSSPEMKQRVIRELKQLRDGLLELAIELRCELIPKFLDSLAHLVAEDGQLDTLRIISKLTGDQSVRHLCTRLGLNYSEIAPETNMDTKKKKKSRKNKNNNNNKKKKKNNKKKQRNSIPSPSPLTKEEAKEEEPYTIPAVPLPAPVPAPLVLAPVPLPVPVPNAEFFRTEAFAFGLCLVTAFVGSVTFYFIWEWIEFLGIKF